MALSDPKPGRTVRRFSALLLVLFVLSLGLTTISLLRPSAVVGDTLAHPAPHRQAPLVGPVAPGTVRLPVAWDDLGPRLVAAGGIDVARFVEQYARAGAPLTAEQQSLLAQASDAPITVEGATSTFLLNFFWAFGLTNRNRVLHEGPMMQGGVEQVGGFASTGGWTLGARSPTELYASADLVSLTADQQARLERVAANVYRPCCDNPTLFPDCNHGMAMLGLLEVLAASGATDEEMFSAAREVNAVWFPRQSEAVATYVRAETGQSYTQVAPHLVTGRELFSASGFRAVQQYLLDNELLPQSPTQEDNCGI